MKKWSVATPSSRPFTALVCVSFVMVGAVYGALAPQLVTMQERVGFTDTQAGTLTGFYTAGMLPGVLGVLVLGNRVGARQLYLSGLVLIAVSTFWFGLADSYGVLVLARAVQGFGAGICFAGGTAWLTDSARPDQRGALLGTAWGGLTLGGVLGPAIGAMSHYSGAAVLHAFVGSAFLAIGLAASRYRNVVRGTTIREPQPARTPVAEPAALGAAIGLLVVPSLVIGTLNALLPLMFAELELSNLMIAAVFFAAAATGGLASPLIGRRTDLVGYRPMLRAGLALGAACAATMAIAGGNALVLACFGALYLGIVNELCSVPAFTAAQSIGSSRGAASIGAAVSAVFAIFETVGAFFAVPLRDYAGTAAPFIGLALVTAASGLMLRALVRRTRSVAAEYT